MVRIVAPTPPQSLDEEIAAALAAKPTLKPAWKPRDKRVEAFRRGAKRKTRGQTKL